jgi:hypothetical protein
MEKKVILAYLYILIFPALILFLSGNLAWLEGWIFSVWFILLCFSTILYLYKKDPALLEERYQKPGTGNQEGWDQYVVYGIVIGFTLWIVTMPLDAQRFGWSPAFPLWLHVIGGAGLAGSFFLFFRSSFFPRSSASRRTGNSRLYQWAYTGLSGIRCTLARS